MKLTETEKYMLAGAAGVAAERISEYYARKYVGMPLWAFFLTGFLSTLGLMQLVLA